ncbi:MAG: DoxX family protein [Acaryochloris sp. RU_4_1]|nr:DoxX family protein [Acaryochloris sp. SU_5_25]NJM64390.1 DoxX family protein [Acaryochloris sp. RU_4_1]NJR53477.1 DoxX family protein [Acaryochloris sp. CRU_2_0]
MIDQLLPVIARGFLSAIFIHAGINHCFKFAGMQQAIASKGFPHSLAMAMAIGAIVLLLGGGFSVLLGFKTRWGAIALILFLIPATLMFHLNFSDPMAPIQFLKNVGLIGGLLLLAQTGSGRYSFDNWQIRRSYGKW